MRPLLVTSKTFPQLGHGRAAAAAPVTLQYNSLTWVAEPEPEASIVDDDVGDDAFVPIGDAYVDPRIFAPRLAPYSPQSWSSVSLTSDELDDNDSEDEPDNTAENDNNELPEMPPRPRTGNYANPKVQNYIRIYNLRNPSIVACPEDTAVRQENLDDLEI